MRVLFFIGFALLLVVSGCSRKVTSTATDSTTDVLDSTHVELKPRSEKLIFPGKSAIALKQIHVDSTGKILPIHIKAKNENAFVDVTVDEDGIVTAKGGCDSLEMVVQLMDKEIFRLKRSQLKITKTVTITITKYKTHGFDIFCRCFFFFVLLGAVLFAYLKFKRYL